MTEIGELVAQSNIKDDKLMCPFCPNKALDDCKAKKQQPNSKVVSKPKQLACTPLVQKGVHSYTTARHHLISAKQCYAKLQRLVRMGSIAKYDINDPPNGIALPTAAHNLRYTVGASIKSKYGKLSAAEKKIVAFAVMDVAKAQWHVGHHAVTVEVLEHWADEEEGKPWRRGHQISYDNEVTDKLLKLISKFEPESECDETKPGDFKIEMDNLSKKIKGKLNKFGENKPEASCPFFVSQLAADYAKIPRPIRKKSKEKKAF